MGKICLFQGDRLTSSCSLFIFNFFCVVNSNSLHCITEYTLSHWYITDWFCVYPLMDLRQKTKKGITLIWEENVEDARGSALGIWSVFQCWRRQEASNITDNKQMAHTGHVFQETTCQEELRDFTVAGLDACFHSCRELDIYVSSNCRLKSSPSARWCISTVL